MVSTVARVISLSSNSSVSRPTIQDNRLRASTILSCLINWLIVKPAPASERGDIAIYKIITSRAYFYPIHQLRHQATILKTL